MIIQPIEETSVVARSVASAVFHALMTKLVAATIVPTVIMPKAAAPIAPTPCLVSMMIEFAVTEVVLIVAVPPTRVTFPKELAPAVVVEATDVDIILFPAVPRTKLPLVAVIAPRVAVRVVEAVNEPVTAVLPVALPMLTTPVPPVPIVVAAAPDALMRAVPTAVKALTLDVPADTVKPLVTVRDPGATRVADRLKVSLLADPVTVIWLAVPNREKLPAKGDLAPPLSPVIVTIAPVVPEPREIQLPDPGHMYAVEATVSSHKVPFTYALSDDVGARVAV